MNRLFIAVFVALLAVGLGANEAEAARLGGGKSVGMQRQAVTPKPASPAQQAAPAAPAAPAAAPAAATPKRSWMGPLAGLAAGLGIGALLSHFGLAEGMADFLLLALLALAVVVAFRFFFRRSQAANAGSSLQYAAATPAGGSPTPQFAAAAGAGTASSTLPEGFDSEAFLRVAKLNFVRLQAANDAKRSEDLREFTTPELFAELVTQMNERDEKDAAQQTDVVTLDAEIIEVVSENGRHLASVLFSGMVREKVGGDVLPFSEIWHLVKPVQGDQGWVIAGIQQAPAGGLR